MAISKVTASFTCTSKQTCGEIVQIYMTASDAKEWTDYTPSGNLNFAIIASKPAAEFFEPQKKYRLTFESEDAIMEAKQKADVDNKAWDDYRSLVFEASEKRKALA